MQGLNKKIIEITETESEFIERVIVFLKPGCDVRLQRNQDKAREYVSGLCCKRKSKVGWLLPVLLAAAALCVAAAVFLL